MRISLLLLLLLLALAASGAQTYQWIDENGQHHFSDRKPVPGTDYSVRDSAQNDLLSSYTATPSTKQTRPQRGSRSRPNGTKSSPAKNKAAQRAATEKRCQSYLEKMKRVQAKLRKGYGEPQGNKLRQQRWALSQRYQRECQ